MSSPINFINVFKAYHEREVYDTFMYGCCYWFAIILKERFNGQIYYLPIENHFITKIENDFYDISGKVILTETPILWSEFQQFDPAAAARIEHYCILKEEGI